MVLLVNWEGNNNMWVISLKEQCNMSSRSLTSFLTAVSHSAKRDGSQGPRPELQFAFRPFPIAASQSLRVLLACCRSPTAVFTPRARHIWNVTFQLLPGCHSQTCLDQPSRRLQQLIVFWCQDAPMSCCWWGSADCSLSCRSLWNCCCCFTQLSWLN